MPQNSAHRGANSGDAVSARQIELLFETEASCDFSSSTTTATPFSSAIRSSSFCFLAACALIKFCVRLKLCERVIRTAVGRSGYLLLCFNRLNPHSLSRKIARFQGLCHRLRRGRSPRVAQPLYLRKNRAFPQTGGQSH